MNILDIFKKRKTNGQGELSSDVANSVSSGITPIPNQPMPIAPDGVTAVRPRIVPNMPVNEDTGYSESAPVNVYPTPSQTTQDEINEQYDKGRVKNPNWTLKQKVGSALEGVLTGFMRGGPLGALAMGVNSGMDRNYYRDKDINKNLNRLVPQLKEQQEAEGFDTRQQQAQTAMNNITTDNQRLQADLQRKSLADTNRTKYWEGLLSDKKQGRDMQSQQIADLMRYRDYLIENGTRNTDAKVKQIDERLKDYDLDRQSRERIAGMRQSTAVNAETGRAERAKARLAAMNDKQKQIAIEGAVRKWMTQNPGASAQDIGDVRKRLIEQYQ